MVGLWDLLLFVLPMKYILDDEEFIFDYQQVKERYEEYASLGDKEFMERLPEIIHSACFISYIKGFGNEVLSDVGIVHELAHLLHLPNDYSLKKIRKKFKTLKLS